MSEPKKKDGVSTTKNTPLSCAQKKIWLLSKMHRNSTAFIVSRVIHINGPLDHGCLQKAWSVVLQNNKCLRINVRPRKKQVFQYIKEEAATGIDIMELSAFKEATAWEKIRESLEDLFTRPFDPESGYLFRTDLFKISDNNNILALCFHRIIIDKTSLDTIIQELLNNYNAFKNGITFQPSRSECDYFDFINYQIDKIKYEKSGMQSFRKDRFSSPPEVLSLPYDHKMLSAHPGRFATHEIRFGSDIYNKLTESCSTAKAGFFDKCIAALYVLLKRYTGQHDICICIPVSGRTEKKFVNVTGPFESLLPVRISIEDHLTFSGVLQEVKQTLSWTLSNQDIPQEATFDDDYTYSGDFLLPLHQVSFNFDTGPADRLSMVDCVCRELGEYSVYGICDLNFVVSEAERLLKGTIQYNTALFSKDTVSRLAEHFAVILNSVLLKPETKVSEINLMTYEEMGIIERWNSTEAGYPVHETIPSLFRQQVDKTPDAVAVIQNGLEFTYLELCRRVELLENRLQKNRIACGDRIAVCMERSIESIVCILAILKSGAVYVPLDPRYPSDRLLYILSDSDVNIILTKIQYGKVLSLSGKRILFLDKESADKEPDTETAMKKNHACSGQSMDPSASSITGHCPRSFVASPDTPIYIMYTSGSTGVPKGIAGRNRGLINRLFWIWDVYPLESGEVCCHRISTAFIDHLAELFTPLLRGVPVVIFNSENVKGPEDFCNKLIDNNISRLVMTPSSLKLLLKVKREKGLQFKSIKYLFCSGEALPVYLAEDFYNEFGSARLINIYGSSEVSADVTFYEVNRFSVRNILHHFNRFSVDKEQLEQHEKYLGHFTKYITRPDADLCDISGMFTNYRLYEAPQTIDQYYGMLYSDLLPFIINTASPRFIGHMTSALPDYLHDLSKLISQLNQNMVKIETSKSLTFLERETLAILHRLFYKFSDDFYGENIQKVDANLGLITTGGTTSNIGALLSARNKLLFGDHDDVSILRESIYSVMHKKGYRDMVIIGSPLMHYSMKKASSILGLGINNILHVEMTSGNQMNTVDLKEKIKYCKNENILILAIVGIAGATETGVIDPLDEIASIAQNYGVHFHVDAAWGGTLIFSGKYSHLLKGIEKADTITMCGHKQLYLPQGISICLFRDPLQISYAATTARYQAGPNTYDFGRFSVEGSRSALSLCLHASLRILGKKGYEALIDDGIEKARFFSEVIMASSAFELIEKPQINIVNYRYIPEKFRSVYNSSELSPEDRKFINDINGRIQRKQFLKGNSFVSKTVLNRKIDDREEAITVFRAVLSNPLTTCDDLYSVLEEQLEIAENLLGDRNDYGKGVINRKIIIRKETPPTDDTQTIPIGKPIYNTKIYIVESAGNIAPIGIQGEICVAGDAVAAGYLNNEELDRRCFVRNPFHKGSYSRLYRTGDLGIYLPDGSVKFLGRIDDQVKIRGIRIECGEVESVLCSNTDIVDAAVMGRKSEGGMELVAFYVLKNGKKSSYEMLRDYLRSKVPEYMIPSVFIEQEKLPVLPNGKIDKKRLKQIADLKDLTEKNI